MQGFNMGRYVPPDVEGTISGNKLHGKHALGSRASKLRTQGALTVRFEMPFGVWCGSCAQPTLIGQGVRFNAEKRKVGNYHSTPVYSFRMRHADCGGAIEIRTDPQNTAYVVVEGGKRRDTGEDNEDNQYGLEPGDPILTDKERDRLRADAFARLEKTIADRAAVEGARDRIAALEDASTRRWEDPYARNRRLRDAFRVGRRQRDGEAQSAGELAERMGLGFEILPGTKEDARRAALVDFGSLARANDGDGGKDEALVRPLFGRPGAGVGGEGGDLSSKKQSKAAVALDSVKKNGDSKRDRNNNNKNKDKNKRLKSEIAASQTRENLVSELVGNTRASQDPFLVLPSSDRGGGGGGDASSKTALPRIPGIKRKRKQPGEIPTSAEEEETNATEAGTVPPKGTESAAAAALPSAVLLVEYDSD
ncbi:CWC16 protein [Biscogniauxia marginata]|nr:CWC16 protein [Biscogniauxia marginata]